MMRPIDPGRRQALPAVPHGASVSGAVMLLGGALLLSGCRHHEQVAYTPPPVIAAKPTHREIASPNRSPDRSPDTRPDRTSLATAPAWQPYAPGDLDAEAAAAPMGYFDDFHAHPVLTETGSASWYGPNYHRHNAADGTVYDQNGMTAAHRTLPLGTTVRVTNLQTGDQVLVRITDRGPFVPGRVLDLSMGAAKAVGLYRLGVAKVRVEAFAHATSDPAGRWCVQTGAFKDQTDALDLKSALLERYHTAKVIEFAGPTGFWVRIDPAARSKTQAEEVLAWIGNPDPMALPYLVRTD